MIEDYQAKRRRARIVSRSLLAFGVFLALVSAVVTYAIASRAPAPDASLETSAVVVATRDLAARTVVTADDVRIARVSADVLPEGALRDPAVAVGRVATQSIAKNEMLVPAKFAVGGGGGFAVYPEGQRPTGTTPDYRAMSLSILDQNAVGGAVRPGDIVDIVFSIGYVPTALGTGTLDIDYAARIVAERVAVLAKDTTTIYTFRVDAAQAERITALQAAGAQLHLLLRAGDDARAPRASGAIFSSEAGGIIRSIPTVRPAATAAPR